MKFDTPATLNPIDQLKVLGKPTDRIDGKFKTTGTAPYAYERHDVVANQAYGYIIGSAIPKGRIASMDLAEAKASAGVVAIVTTLDVPRLGRGRMNYAYLFGGAEIQHYHQAIAIVIAETFEQARAAASLIRVEYAPSTGRFDLAAVAAEARPRRRLAADGHREVDPPAQFRVVLRREVDRAVVLFHEIALGVAQEAGRERGLDRRIRRRQRSQGIGDVAGRVVGRQHQILVRERPYGQLHLQRVAVVGAQQRIAAADLGDRGRLAGGEVEQAHARRLGGLRPVTYRLIVNGEPAEVAAPGMRRLLDVLREDLGLTGTKEGCGEGECGACTVLVDGEVVVSCLVPVCQVDGSVVHTVEGLAAAGGHPDGLGDLQDAFLVAGGGNDLVLGQLGAALRIFNRPGVGMFSRGRQVIKVPEIDRRIIATDDGFPGSAGLDCLTIIRPVPLHLGLPVRKVLAYELGDLN